LKRPSAISAKLTPKAQADVTDIRVKMSSGAPDAVTKRRYFRYILNAGTFPVPMVAMKVPSGLSLIDGSHRMAAFSALREIADDKFAKLNVKKAVLQQDVWIGTHSDGEVPLARNDPGVRSVIG
jgi:hypothetical protein